uniref:Uncharacterized protein n=2 Tax=Klebsiella/Raoultella group TaxID=2890311 RepID=A0A345WYI8_KLEPN|nr:hypothetical protein pKpNDM1_00346 [Raoultella planticola]AXJ98741.1 hypothetical protein [Klebsiella pneumoniae]UGK55372.1 Hypothetical protein [Raoultella ornithinolytica]UUW42164.1 hypothetical protein [Klebsiella michiganensis]UVN19615.1 hypothetical protein [Klebsiella michiganensis]
MVGRTVKEFSGVVQQLVKDQEYHKRTTDVPQAFQDEKKPPF